jgi:hypothetical protein
MLTGLASVSIPGGVVEASEFLTTLNSPAGALSKFLAAVPLNPLLENSLDFR